MRSLTVVVCSVLFAGLAWAQPSPVAEKKPASPEAASAGGAVDLLVFAPHPDDEMLSCAGIIRQALLAGKRVKIVIITNGDGLPDFASALARKTQEKLTAEDYLELARYRQKQTQAALAVLGGKEEDLIFLGYPDSGLEQVYQAKGAAPFQQKFTRKSETYGVAQTDFHSAAHGRPAPYTHAAALADFVELIRAFKPLELYVTNEGDEHPDHKAAFWFVRDAVKAVGHRGEIFTYVNHGGPEWPWPWGFTPEMRFESHEVNGRQVPLGVPWPPSRRVQLAPEVVQLKLRAIQAHTIPMAEGEQRRFEYRREYFKSFVKVEEVFWAVAQDIPKEERKGAAQEAATALEQVATGFRLAEGPVWDGENLIFSDVFPSKIHKLGSDRTVSTIRSDTRKGAGLAFDSKHRLLICEVDGFRVTRVEKDGSETTLAESYEGKKLNGPNDLTVDAKGGIYFTDPLFLNKDKREQDKEAVYYISPDGKILRVADDMERPNGIALNKDGKTLFVADTAKSKLRAYPVKEDGMLGAGRDFGSVTGPDGVKVDPDGNVYAAGKSGIAVFDASGKRLGTLKVPVTPNGLVFGDKDRRTMYITTAPSVYKVRLDQALKMLIADEK